MADALVQGFLLLLTPESLFMITAGIIIGLFLGVIPGLGGLATLALLTPLVYGMEPVPALALVLAAYSSVYFGGSVSAILLNTPGTGEQVVTTFDGYPMTQQKKGARALGISATASALGGIFGVLIVFVTLPFMRQLVMYFASPEVFALGLLGVFVMGIVGAGSVSKGILSGLLGMLVAFVGYDPVTGIPRLTFGNLMLFDGLGITAITMGLFAVSEMISLFVKGRAVAGTTDYSFSNEKGHRLWDGVLDCFIHWRTTLRGGIVGAAAGIIPGMGGTVAMFFSYGLAKQVSKTPELFGKGAPEGVVAAESSNNAKEGGSLVPTLALGIPGTSGMALFMGILLILGFTPGPGMLTEHLDIVFVMSWAIILGSIFASIIGLGLTPLLVKASYLRPELLAPLIISISLLGSFLEQRMLLGVVLAIVTGFIGYLFKIMNYSNAGITLGFMLGPIIEKNLFQALQAYGPTMIFRPLTLVIFLTGLYLIISPYISRKRMQKKRVAEGGIL